MDSVYLSSGTDGLRREDLAGFFVGWTQPPSPDDRLGILAAADEVVVARDRDGVVIGFATAITDYRFATYIPLVEVLPEHQGQSIGSQIVQALLERLGKCYMIDLVCDDDVVPFYERLGGTRLNAVAWRNHDQLHAKLRVTGVFDRRAASSHTAGVPGRPTPLGTKATTTARYPAIQRVRSARDQPMACRLSRWCSDRHDRRLETQRAVVIGAAQRVAIW